MQRKEVTDEVLMQVLEMLTQNIGNRLQKHGRGAFASPHEGFGILAEENIELATELRLGDANRIAEEWMDVGVTAVFAVASMVNVVETPTEEPVKEVAPAETVTPSGLIITSELPSTSNHHCVKCLDQNFCDGPCEGENFGK